MATWQSLFTEKVSEKFGYVYTLAEAERIVELYLSSTTCRFVPYRIDKKNFGNTGIDVKRYENIKWEFSNTKFHEPLPYTAVPFVVSNMKVLNCQFGMDKSGKRRKMLRAQHYMESEQDSSIKKQWQDFITHERDCPANIAIVEVYAFPDFTLGEDSKRGRELVLPLVFKSLNQDSIKKEHRFYVTLPLDSDHQFHPFTNSNSSLRYKRVMTASKPVPRKSIRAVVVPSTGRVEDIKIQRIPYLNFTGIGKVTIDVHSTALNREDIYQMKKTDQDNPSKVRYMGMEVSGIISNIGKDSKWSIGDKVIAYLSGGGCAEKVTVNEGHVMPAPECMTLPYAAAVPQAWLTAYHLLCFDASMKEGDIALIHAGASGIGTALIQLVTLGGGQAIVTTSSQGKIDVCKSLGAVEGFCYKSMDFAKEIVAYLNGKEVNLIFDAVSGSYWQLNSRLIAPGGTWIIYGLLSGPYVAGDMRLLLSKNVTIKTSLLRSKPEEYITQHIDSFTEKVLPCFKPNDGYYLRPVVNRFYDFEQIQDAYKFLESNQSVGKLVLSIKKEVKTRKKDVASTSSDQQEVKAASSHLLAVNQIITKSLLLEHCLSEEVVTTSKS